MPKNQNGECALGKQDSMDVTEALAREKSWRKNAYIRPRPDVAKAVAAALADRVEELEKQLMAIQPACDLENAKPPITK